MFPLKTQPVSVPAISTQIPPPTLPLVLPPTVLGYYLLVVLGRGSPLGKIYEWTIGQPLVFTWQAAVVAALFHATPLLIKSARAALEGVDPTLLKAARTLGAGPVRAFFTVHLPLARPGLVAGVMLAFARALGDFGVTLMVAGDIPGQTQTAALAIYDLSQAGQERAAAGLVAVLTSVTIVALYTVNKLTARPPHD